MARGDEPNCRRNIREEPVKMEILFDITTYCSRILEGIKMFPLERELLNLGEYFTEYQLEFSRNMFSNTSTESEIFKGEN